MNLLMIALKSIRQRALASSLTSLSVALGVTMMVTVLVIYGVTVRMFSQTATGYHLIVGSKGSKLQLVLNTVYRVSQPIENLPYRIYREMRDGKEYSAYIKECIPIALGDVTSAEEGGFPIVGTIPQYFLKEYIPGRPFQRRGDIIRNPFDATIGSIVAHQNGWDIGSKLKLVHGGVAGHVHDEEFTVVSVLAPTGTPNDKTVFIHLDGFFLISGHEKPAEEAINRLIDFYPEDAEMYRQTLADHLEEEKKHAAEAGEGGHAHHHHNGVPDWQKEVTAILVTVKGKSLGEQVRRMVVLESQMSEDVKSQAVNPAREIGWLMQNIVGNVRTLILALTSLIIVVSGVSIFVSIYNSMSDRRKEIAIMRALGARRGTVFSIILLESILLCVIGGVVGVLLGHGAVLVAAPFIAAKSGLLVDAFAFEPLEFLLIPALIVLASIIGFVPGMTAYRTDVAKTLS